MKSHTGQNITSANFKWFVLAGIAATAALGAALAQRLASDRSTRGAVGKHAWLVATRQARREAKWTRQALVHSSEARTL